MAEAGQIRSGSQVVSRPPRARLSVRKLKGDERRVNPNVGKPEIARSLTGDETNPEPKTNQAPPIPPPPREKKTPPFPVRYRGRGLH